MHCWLPNEITTQVCMVWSCIPRSGCHATLGANYQPDQAVYFGPKSRMYSTLLITNSSSSTPVIIRTCGKFSVRDPQSLGESQGPNINSQDIWQLGLLLSDRWWVATRKFKVDTASTLFAKLVRNYLAPECVRPQGLVRVALERDVVPGRVDGHVPIALADGAVAAHQRVRLQRRGDLERQADGAAVAVGLVGGKHSSGRRDGEAHDCIGGFVDLGRQCFVQVWRGGLILLIQPCHRISVGATPITAREGAGRQSRLTNVVCSAPKYPKRLTQHAPSTGRTYSHTSGEASHCILGKRDYAQVSIPLETSA